jgi:hypothetical protein
MIRTLASIALLGLGLYVLMGLNAVWGVFPLAGCLYLSLGGGRARD